MEIRGCADEVVRGIEGSPKPRSPERKDPPSPEPRRKEPPTKEPERKDPDRRGPPLGDPPKKPEQPPPSVKWGDAMRALAGYA